MLRLLIDVKNWKLWINTGDNCDTQTSWATSAASGDGVLVFFLRGGATGCGSGTTPCRGNELDLVLCTMSGSSAWTQTSPILPFSSLQLTTTISGMDWPRCLSTAHFWPTGLTPCNCKMSSASFDRVSILGSVWCSRSILGAELYGFIVVTFPSRPGMPTQLGLSKMPFVQIWLDNIREAGAVLPAIRSRIASEFRQCSAASEKSCLQMHKKRLNSLTPEMLQNVQQSS